MWLSWKVDMPPPNHYLRRPPPAKGADTPPRRPQVRAGVLPDFPPRLQYWGPESCITFKPTASCIYLPSRNSSLTAHSLIEPQTKPKSLFSYSCKNCDLLKKPSFSFFLSRPVLSPFEDSVSGYAPLFSGPFPPHCHLTCDPPRLL